MSTVTTNTASLLPVAEFLNRVDERVVGDLVSRSGTRVTPSALLTDPRLAAALLSATGKLERACLVKKRYTPGDLANLVAPANAGGQQAGIWQLLSDMTMLSLWGQRPDKGPVPPHLEYVEGELERLRDGVEIFGLVEVQDAGLLDHQTDTPDDLFRRNGMVIQAGRFYGIRCNEWNGYRGW